MIDYYYFYHNYYYFHLNSKTIEGAVTYSAPLACLLHFKLADAVPPAGEHQTRPEMIAVASKASFIQEKGETDRRHQALPLNSQIVFLNSSC